MKVTATGLATALALVAAMFAVIPAAHAEPGQTIKPAEAQAAGPYWDYNRIAADGDSWSCFEYTGYFKGGSDVVLVDWDGNDIWDECFGIAPGRTIWHAWPQSGGWQQMPHNGRADDVWSPFYSDGRRSIRVKVAASGNYWCSTRNAGPGWGAWYRC